MNTRLCRSLFWVGVAFFLQAVVLLSLFFAESRSDFYHDHPRPSDLSDMVLYIVQLRVGQMVGGMAGSLFGCLALWLLLLYLRIRQLERKIADLGKQTEQAEEDSDSGIRGTRTGCDSLGRIR